MKDFLKKVVLKFGRFKKSAYLCIAIKKNGPVAQLNRASDYGSEGYRFESCRGKVTGLNPVGVTSRNAK